MTGYGLVASRVTVQVDFVKSHCQCVDRGRGAPANGAPAHTALTSTDEGRS